MYKSYSKKREKIRNGNVLVKVNSRRLAENAKNEKFPQY